MLGNSGLAAGGRGDVDKDDEIDGVGEYAGDMTGEFKGEQSDDADEEES